MTFTETNLKGAYVIDLKRIEDERGFFARSYCKNLFEKHGLNTNVVQANVASTKKAGTLRGMHMQTVPYSESKLVRCTRGAIFDVIVDLRKDSETYLQWFGVELTEENFRMLYVPEEFAHGYLTLRDDSDVNYQVTQFYTPEAEVGFRWDDPAFNIQWPIRPVIISAKDQNQPLFNKS